MNHLIFSSLINIELWDRAEWLGIAYLNPYGDPPRPGIGLIFKNEAAAIELFTELQQRIGIRDTHEELRVAFIEGDIPGQDPGYTVAIGSDVERIVQRARASGVTDENALKIATISRLHRLGNSGTLDTFRRFLVEHKRYDILPVTLEGPRTPKPPLTQFAIEKRNAVFRRVDEIKGNNDLDWIVLGKSAAN